MAVASQRAILWCRSKDVKIMCPGEPASVAPQGCEMTTDHHSSVAVFPLIQCPVLTYRKRSLGALESWGCSTGLSLSETSCLTSDSEQC